MIQGVRHCCQPGSIAPASQDIDLAIKRKKGGGA